MKDKNIDTVFAGKTKRFFNVGKNVTGFATKLATKKLLGINLDNSKNALELSSALGGLKGPIMKVAQLIAAIPDALPPEYAEELSKLQSEAPSMGWFFVKRRMRAELGEDWMQKFSSFDKDAIKAASLGQVHKATNKKGQILACKLQYPDMLSAINSDLKQLKIIMNIYKQFDNAIHPSDIFLELSERLLEELDYEKEKKKLIYI